MRTIFKFRFMGTLIMLVMIAGFSAAVMLLWNALLPGLFGFSTLNYLQAMGILLLVRILFGGLGGGLTHRNIDRVGEQYRRHGNRLREKWMNMNEDERKEFFEKEKSYSRFHEEEQKMEGSNE